MEKDPESGSVTVVFKDEKRNNFLRFLSNYSETMKDMSEGADSGSIPKKDNEIINFYVLGMTVEQLIYISDEEKEKIQEKIQELNSKQLVGLLHIANKLDIQISFRKLINGIVQCILEKPSFGHKLQELNTDIKNSIVEEFSLVLPYKTKHTLEYCASSLVYSSDSKYLIYAPNKYDKYDDVTVCMRDVVTDHIVYKLKGHRGHVNSVACSPDGKYIASGSSDKTVRIWNVVNGKCMKTLEKCLKMEVCSLDYSPDSKFLTFGGDEFGDDTGVYRWNVVIGELLKINDYKICSVKYSPDGKHLALGTSLGNIYMGSRGNVHICDAVTGEDLKIIKTGKYSAPIKAVYSPDGESMVCYSTSFYNKTSKILQVALPKKCNLSQCIDICKAIERDKLKKKSENE